MKGFMKVVNTNRSLHEQVSLLDNILCRFEIVLSNSFLYLCVTIMQIKSSYNKLNALPREAFKNYMKNLS